MDEAHAKRTNQVIFYFQTEEKSDQTYHYGNETVTLFCTANLGDKAEFKEWIKDDKVLEDGKEYKILENGTLTIPELSMYHLFLKKNLVLELISQIERINLLSGF